ncbi:hypothetical protein IV203_018587 [Nitzschia inconspicua]|uniref:EF-hand domain-containing protein n=1 Tax=Nitzschia inconspicua TaxID=303405 RepID=A0A9K3M2C6_9STRA|nr:hypothetical protein IV203_018587 [Nitzschia inconspicua]
MLIHPSHSQSDQDCASNLYSSDADGNRQVDSEEYVTFVKLEGPESFLPNVEFFVQLPIMLQSNFYTLACFCRSQGGASDCCVGNNAHMSTSGTGPGEIPTDQQANYLNLVCGLTAQAINLAVSEQTSSPTEFSVSVSPSVAPSVAITIPETQAPSRTPSETPSQMPSSGTVEPPTSIPTESATIVDPPISQSPTGIFDPSLVIVRASYTILVPNGQTENVPVSSYEGNLIGAMDELALNVASELELPAVRGEGGLRRWLLMERPIDNSRRRRLEEIVVMLPTGIIDIVDVGFTDDPQLIGGKFVRGPCPYDLGDPTKDLCQEVTASIELDLSTLDNDPLLVYGLYLAALDRAILAGELGSALSAVASDSPVEIASGQEAQGGSPPTDVPTVSPTTMPVTEERSGLSGGAIAGISAGAAVLLILLYYAFSSQREHEQKIKRKKETARKLRQEASERNQKDPEAPLTTGGGYGKKTKDDGDTLTTAASTALVLENDGNRIPQQSNLGQQLIVEGEEKRPEEEDIVVNAEDDPATLLAASVPYIVSPKREKDKTELMPRIEIEGSENVVPYGTSIPTESRSIGNISHESEAGWSEAYTSSMGSVSDDELVVDSALDTPPLGQQMVSILPNSPLAKGSPKGEDVTVEDKLETLESAIVSGDWAAVGATAAALASMQDTQSRSEVSKGSTGLSNVSSLMSQSWKNKIDSAKANQLDQLIERGDWEGIILAAANFEEEENGTTNAFTLANAIEKSSDDSQGRLMVHEDGSDDEYSGRDYYTASNHSSRRSSRSSVISQKRTRDEFREEVLALVQEVVPEEVDHVDEMLEQFAGREQELIDTLETMQERAEAMNSANGRSAKSIFKGTLG